MSKIHPYPRIPTVVGTGLVALDIVISSNPDVPPYQWAGGTCGNVLTILSYLGWNAYPIARLNAESSAMHAKKDMERWKIKMDFIGTEPVASIPVITQEITTDKNGLPKHKFHWKNCPKCGSWLPNYRPVTLKATAQVKQGIAKADVFFFDRVSPGALDLARYYKSSGCTVFFEPSAKGNPKQFEEAISLADIVKYSDQRFTTVVAKKSDALRPSLEIQTLGENGLRYRTKHDARWSHLPACKAVDLVDTCGCGDWTTAGIIHRLVDIENSGAEDTLSQPVIEAAMRYGQALGAWNCGFEGARSGMYQVSKKQFFSEIDSILQGGSHKPRHISKALSAQYASDGLCPACPH
tara:strand:+ start:57 stop:1109 length:1053 start_codon:yes stop_codon:yes gene_type:complete